MIKPLKVSQTIAGSLNAAPVKRRRTLTIAGEALLGAVLLAATGSAVGAAERVTRTFGLTQIRNATLCIDYDNVRSLVERP